MKKIILLLLLFTGIVNAQIVNIPDANFKAKLLQSSTTSNVAANLLGQNTKIDANDNGEIDVSEAENILRLVIPNANIASLEGINAFVNLRDLFCEGNLLTSLDISTLHQLDLLTIHDSPNLSVLILKNGLINFNVPPPPPIPIGIGGVDFYNCPNLQYVCIDENRYQDGLFYLNAYYADSNNITLNSYCSFNPGGNYNTINGTVYHDCDIDSATYPYIKVNIHDGTSTASTFTTANGTYEFFTSSGNFTITPEIENLSFFSMVPPNAIVHFPAVDQSIQSRDFCVNPNAVHPDLEITFVPVSTARPGMDALYKIIYKNKGNQVLSSLISLDFDETRSDFVSAVPNTFDQGTNLLVWAFTDLRPFETRHIDLTLRLRTPPIVNQGDVLNYTARIQPVVGDESPSDNVFPLHQPVVNSLDPNRIFCLEGNTIDVSDVGKFLHYNIDFENTGTAEAINVVVKDSIDFTKFDIDSLQLQYASHAVETKITGNVVEFIFKNIHLNGGPIGGHGNVLFKIKTLPDLIVGNEVIGNANIYFDYNAPIETNEERTVIANLSKNDFIKDASITVAPNPAKDFISISAKNTIKSIQLFDAQGRILKTILDNKKSFTLDISNKAQGVYFIKVNTDKGSSVQKIIKE